MNVVVKRLGRVDYAPTFQAMQDFTASRTAETPDEMWIVEHPPVYTLGQAGKPEHILRDVGIPTVRIDRGGQVTYHGPGQIVAYPLVDLRRIGIGVREFVQRIEQAMINTMAVWNIEAQRKEGAPGVYVNGEKIGALGLRVRRGCTFHGLAFNINMDLEPFSRINPCGYEGLQVTSMLNCGGPGDLAVVKAELVKQMAKQLNLSPEFTTELPDLSFSDIQLA